MIIDALHLLARANLTASVAIAAIALLRWPVRSLFGARHAYGLWVIPLMVAFAALVPAPEGAPISPIVLGVINGLPAAAPPGGGSSWPAFVCSVWALGGLICATLLGVQQVRFAFAVGRGRPELVNGSLVLRAARIDIGPAVVGSRIILPYDFEARFTPAEQAAILAHEAQHVARGDALANAVVTLIQCICWFNPLVHLAARWIRFDQELACDAAVMADQPSLRRPYAEALLKTQALGSVPPVGCAWRTRDFLALRNRILLLEKRAPNSAVRAVGAPLLVALTLGCGCAAWASQPAQRVTLVKPDWSSRPSRSDLVRFYPAKALSLELDGTAVMRCHVGRTGGLSACAIMREAPQGAGFGNAALQMMPLFQMKPMGLNGRPVAGGIVRIPVRFKLQPNDAGQ